METKTIVKSKIDSSQLKSERKNLFSFIVFWTGQQFSLLGSEIVQFSIAWVLTVWYQNPAILSLSMFLTFLPRVILGPLAGVIADRFDYKKMILLFDFLQSFFTVGLIVVLFAGYNSIWLFLVFNTLRACFQTFHSPLVGTLLPLMVPRKKLSRFQGLNQLSMNIILTIVPIASALMLNRWTIEQILWIDVITFVIASGLLLITKIPKNQNNHKKTKEKQGVFKNFGEGISIIRKIPGLMAILIIAFLGNFFLTPFNTLMTYFINVTHSGTVTDMAIVSVVMQGAMIVGSMFVMVKKNWKRKSAALLVTITLVFTGIIVTALAPVGNFWIISIGGLLTCVAVPIFPAIFMTITQLSVPIEKMGRVIAFVGMMMSVMSPLGYIISGPLANWMGIIPLFIASSLLGIAATFFIGIVGKIKKIDIRP